MIKKFIKGKIAVFVDASNVYHSQNQLGWRIDFQRLKRYFEKNGALYKIYYYTAFDPDHPQQRKFLDFLEIIGFTVRKKKVKFIKDRNHKLGGFHKGNLDVELTIDAVDSSNKFQSFILFSGDSDFDALLKYMKAYKKKCIVISTKNHISLELIKQAKFIDLKKLRKDIEKGRGYKK